MKKFVISVRTLKDYPDMDTACRESGMLGKAPDVLDVFIEELSAELADEIIAEHEAYEAEIGGTGIDAGGGCVKPEGMLYTFGESTNEADPGTAVFRVYDNATGEGRFISEAEREGEQTGKVFDVAAFKNRNKH